MLKYTMAYSLKIYEEHTHSPNPHRVVGTTDSLFGTSKEKSMIAMLRCSSGEGRTTLIVQYAPRTVLYQLQSTLAALCQFCFCGTSFARIDLVITWLMNVTAKFRITVLVITRFQRPVNINTVI